MCCNKISSVELHENAQSRCYSPDQTKCSIGLGGRLFSKLDLTTALHQSKVNIEDILKKPLNTTHSHFEFLVMPMGLEMPQQPSTIWLMQFFRDCVTERLVICPDDVLELSDTRKKHFDH